MPSEAKEQFVSAMESALAGLRERSQLRSFAQLEGINFCSNDYLGLAEDPRLKDAVLESVKRAARMAAQVRDCFPDMIPPGMNWRKSLPRLRERKRLFISRMAMPQILAYCLRCSTRTIWFFQMR